MKKVKLPGFTLIEILIVVGILTILLSIVIVAVNALDQINKSSDVATNQVTKDLTSAIQYYYSSQQTLPWTSDQSCRNELSTGQSLTDLPSCVKDLTNGGQLQTSYLSSNETKNVYVTECNNAVAVCYSPQSKEFNEDPDTKYTKNGVLEPGCPSANGASKDCYACTFSTNNAQECFQALNPNGSLAIVPSPSPDQPLPITSRNSVNSCSNPTSGGAACLAKVVSDSGGTPLSSLAVTGGYGPTQLHTAYNLPCTPGGTINATCPQPSSFGPQIVAIVDAYNDPTVASDLATYDQKFNLPACSIANGCLTIFNESGQTSPLPATDGTWALEESLDVQMAHAVCQTCKILLVETQSNLFGDLAAGVNVAAQEGATSISNSYGASEWSGQTFYDGAAYNHPGIFITVSAGDHGYGTLYPAASKNVIAVGGTTLSLLSNYTYSSESAWSGTGSGCSLYEAANSFQLGVQNWNSTGCGTKRSLTDISADADPSTGVAVYDTTPYYQNPGGWYILGGTSVSSPIVSAELALIGSASPTDEGTTYLYTHPSLIRDVATGSNGSCGGTTTCTAAVGYDGPTGLGSLNLLAVAAPNPTTAPSTNPTAVPSQGPSPTSTPIHYAIDDTKLLDTYAVFTYPDPGFSSQSYGWGIDVSYRPDFGGVVHDFTDPGNGANADTFTRFAYAGSGMFGGFGSVSDNARLAITHKYVAFQSTPNILWGNYQQCGKTLYYRVANYNNPHPQQFSPTYSAVIDCTTQVGVVDPPLSWYSVWNEVTQTQKQYNSLWDADNNGVINWTDYVMMALETKTRAGGWQPPEITSSSSNNSGRGSGNNPSGGMNPTATPTPTPTTPPLNCSQNQTVTLNQTNPVNALPGDTVYNTLTVTSSDSPGCSSLYTISQGFPTGWIISGIPPSFTLTGGATEIIPFTVKVPVSAAAGNYIYQFWVAKAGQTSVNPVNGTVQVQQVGPTPTPTPKPISCGTPFTQSLGSTTLSGNAGDTLNETITINNNNPVGCNPTQYVISYAYPSGFVINGLHSVTISAGQNSTINFTITIPTGAQVQAYNTEYYVNNLGPGLTNTINVTSIANPPAQQMFSNFATRPFGTYALFMFSYNGNGSGSYRLDVATDTSDLNQTTGINGSTVDRNFSSTSGVAMDSSNIITPTSTQSFIVSSPQSWSGWKCGSTIYYRMYNVGDLRIASPIESTTVDCTTVVNVLPWSPWYAAIYQGIYDSRYDADNNGVVNWTDYWILVKATELR